MKNGILTAPVPVDTHELTIRRRFGRILSICSNAFQILKNQVKLSELSNGTPLPENYNFFRLTETGNADIKNDNQRYLQFLLGYANIHNSRKCNGKVMKPIYTDDGTATQTWEFLEDIDTFVNNTPNNDVFGEKYLLMLTGNGTCAEQCIKHLNNITTFREFPELKPDRLVFSFTNGIYFGKGDIFKKYSDLTVAEREVVACKYFPVAFPEDIVTDWRTIQTPLFERILTDQKLERSVIDCIYVFCGRMLYEIGERDRWQVALYIFGVAKSGKFTIAEILEMFFDEIHIGVLTCGNFEKNFGLDALSNKLMYTCHPQLLLFSFYFYL